MKFNNETELIDYIENTLGLDVLGVFNDYVNTINPLENDSEEIAYNLVYYPNGSIKVYFD